MTDNDRRALATDYARWLLDIIEKAHDAAEDEPARVYVKDHQQDYMCLYRPTEQNELGCLIGQAIYRNGVDFDDMPEGQPADWQARYFFRKRAGLPLPSFDEGGAIGDPDDYTFVVEQAEAWLVEAQATQDRGYTWETAVRGADRMYPAVADLIVARHE